MDSIHTGCLNGKYENFLKQNRQFPCISKKVESQFPIYFNKIMNQNWETKKFRFGNQDN